MFNKFKKLLYLPLIIVICSFLMICPAQAADEPPAVGDSLPPIKLAVPDDPQAKSHLGLSGTKRRTKAKIEAGTTSSPNIHLHALACRHSSVPNPAIIQSLA